MLRADRRARAGARSAGRGRRSARAPTRSGLRCDLGGRRERRASPAAGASLRRRGRRRGRGAVPAARRRRPQRRAPARAAARAAARCSGWARGLGAISIASAASRNALGTSVAARRVVGGAELVDPAVHVGARERGSGAERRREKQSERAAEHAADSRSGAGALQPSARVCRALHELARRVHIARVRSRFARDSRARRAARALLLPAAVLRALPLLARARAARMRSCPTGIGIAPPGDADPARLARRARSSSAPSRVCTGAATTAPGGWALVLAGASRSSTSRSAGSASCSSRRRRACSAWSAASQRALRVSLGAGEAVTRVSVDARGTAWVATRGRRVPARAPARASSTREPSLPPGAIARARERGRRDLWSAFDGALYAGDAERGFSRRRRGLEPGWWELLRRDVVGRRRHTPRCRQRGAGGSTRRARASSSSASVSCSRCARSGERVFVASERGSTRSTLARGSATAPGSSGCRCRCYGLALAGGELLGRDRPRARRVRARRRRARDRRSRSRAARGDRPAQRAPRARASQIAALQRAVLALPGARPRRAHGSSRSARAGRPLARAARGARTCAARRREERRQQHHVFTSGALHNLCDRERSHPDGWDVAVSLTWELADLALARQRARDLARAAPGGVAARPGAGAREPPLLRAPAPARRARGAARRRRAKRAELELAAAELAAQLDAWSGGVFSRLAATHPSTQREP